MKLWRLLVGELLTILLVVAGYIYLPYCSGDGSAASVWSHAA